MAFHFKVRLGYLTLICFPVTGSRVGFAKESGKAASLQVGNFRRPSSQARGCSQVLAFWRCKNWLETPAGPTFISMISTLENFRCSKAMDDEGPTDELGMSEKEPTDPGSKRGT